MSSPESNQFEPPVVILQDIAQDITAAARGGYTYIQAVNPDPRALHYPKFGEPFGLHVSDVESRHPAFGPYRDTYLHSHHAGVLQTDRLVLAGDLLYTEKRPGEFFPIRDEEVYYLHHAFVTHGAAAALQFGGMQLKKEAGYFESLERLMVHTCVDRLQSYLNQVLTQMNEKADVFAAQKIDLTGGIGGAWVEFGLLLQDEVREDIGSTYNIETDLAGESKFKVVARLANASDRAAKFTISPYSYRRFFDAQENRYTQDQTASDSAYGKPIVVVAGNKGAKPTIELPVTLTHRQRTLALSDVNRILNNAHLVTLQ